MAVTANKLHPRGVRTALALPFLVLAYAPPALALDWRFEPNVRASATYTDNANHSEGNPEDALILSVMPNFTLSSQGSRRVQATLQYGLRGVARFGEDNSNDLNHNLYAIGNAELIEDFLFVDGSARISQELISLFGSPAEADINDSNRATVGTYSVSPYIQRRLGTFANAQARYTTSGAIFENDAAADSASNSFAASLISGTRFNDLSWGLNYSIRDTQNRGDADATFESASATVGYALSRKFRVFGTVGEEWNEYSTSGTNNSIDGSFYSVGFGWAPTRRTSIEASVGERYIGRTYSLSGSHRTRMSRWTVGYFEDVSDVSEQQLDQSNRLYFVCDTVPHFPPATHLSETRPPGCIGPYPGGGLAAALGSFGYSKEDLVSLGFPSFKGVYITKSFNAGVSWDVGRMGFGLSAQDTKRLYVELFEAQDHVQRLTGSVSYRMSPQTTANSSLSFSRVSADALLSGGTARDDDIVTFSLGLNHRFAEDLSGALIFRHTQRDSNAANSDYDVNSITATVNMAF